MPVGRCAPGCARVVLAYTPCLVGDSRPGRPVCPRGRPVPSRDTGYTRVASTATCAPWYKGRPRASASGTSRFMSRSMTMLAVEQAAWRYPGASSSPPHLQQRGAWGKNARRRRSSRTRIHSLGRRKAAAAGSAAAARAAAARAAAARSPQGPAWDGAKRERPDQGHSKGSRRLSCRGKPRRHPAAPGTTKTRICSDWDRLGGVSNRRHARCRHLPALRYEDGLLQGFGRGAACLARKTGSVSAHDAKHAATRPVSADRSPSPPSRRGSCARE